MKFGFFLGNIQEIGKHTELSLDRNGAKRTQQRRNIFGGVFWLQSLVGIVVQRLLRILGLAAK